MVFYKILQPFGVIGEWGVTICCNGRRELWVPLVSEVKIQPNNYAGSWVHLQEHIKSWVDPLPVKHDSISFPLSLAWGMLVSRQTNRSEMTVGMGILATDITKAQSSPLNRWKPYYFFMLVPPRWRYWEWKDVGSLSILPFKVWHNKLAQNGAVVRDMRQCYTDISWFIILIPVFQYMQCNSITGQWTEIYECSVKLGEVHIKHGEVQSP